jgi:hypothetical protein
MNGGFLIGGLDDEADVRGAYVMARFRLQMPEPITRAKVYVVGGFCGWHPMPAHELAYDAMRGEYAADVLLKQGVYDYAYAVVQTDGEIDYRQMEGNYAQTENTYTILVYVQSPGEVGARLLGVQQVSTR